MIRHLNEQKEKQKEEINKENDDYFAILESSSSEEGFDINKIEQLMLERRKKLKETLDKADSEMTSNVEAPTKKMPKVRRNLKQGEDRTKINDKPPMRRVRNIKRLILLP